MSTTVAEQLLPKSGGGSVLALSICTVASTLLFAALLYLLGISPVPLLLALGAFCLLWLAYSHTVTCLGAFLAFMPFFPLFFLLAKFASPSYIGQLEGIDRVVLLLLTILLFVRNRIRLILPDYLLLLAFGLASLRLALDGSLLALSSDFGLVIPYAAGRLVRLTSEQEATWGKRAVWIMAVVSVLGLVEVLLLGQGPRVLLYLKVAAEQTANGDALIGTFHGSEFSGLRVSGTQFGPLQFGALCMAAVVLWWVYSRKATSALLIGFGFIGSLARGAWLGTALAISLVAMGMGQTKRIFRYGILALILFVAAVPILDIGGFLAATKSGEDSSALGHQNQMALGAQFVLTHPLGIGSANFGRQAEKSNPDAFYFEGAYFTFLGGYGIPITLCLVAFMVAAIKRAWQLRTQLGYAAAGIVVGFNVVMVFLAVHDVFPVICWVWFPLGLAVTHFADGQSQSVSANRMMPVMPR
jgi:hypothetical protein